ncbi:MAG TPA: hypothetical protein VFE60_11525 [Roseiarcus sp.]|jgi:hypothetical protein|nr:hypothetical protein [Roseiarcus sp.]
MSRTQARLAISAALIGLLPAAPAIADTTFFSTGGPDENIATASRPETAGFEIESADDFVLTKKTSITDATFTGLIPTGASPTKSHRRNLSGISGSFGCRAHAQGADARQFAVGCRIRRSRLNQRPEFLDCCEEP